MRDGYYHRLRPRPVRLGLACILCTLTLAGCSFSPFSGDSDDSSSSDQACTNGLPYADPWPGGAEMNCTQSVATGDGWPTPPTTVLVSSGPQVPTVEPMQEWMTDALAGDEVKLAGNCWTRSPEDVARVYADPAIRGALAEAVTHPAIASQRGVQWDGNKVAIFAPNAEMDSNYSCPQVTKRGGESQVSNAELTHRVRRYLLRLAGTPINRMDTEENYPLLCDRSPSWNPDGIGQQVPPVLSAVGQLQPDGSSHPTNFSVADMSVHDGAADYRSVRVPVTLADGSVASGRVVKATFVMNAGSGGGCIGEVKLT